MKVWIDIDNPPQARYLLPFVRRFEQAGHDVLVTARAHGQTLPILRAEGVTFEPIGSSFGYGLPRKVYGLRQRALKLVDLLRRQGASVDLVLTASRSATVAARRLGIASFVIIDYEHVNLLVYGLSGSHIVYPSVIDPVFFRRRGVRRRSLLPFEGLKEDVSFADVDFSAVAPCNFGDEAACILFRPPAEDSHYYRSESRDLALEVLRYLAAQGATVVFSPRLDRQVEYLDEVGSWREDPVVLYEPLPFVSLLKGVDGVVSAGGTMLREAAYLGVPAYSIFRGRLGAVDRYLASIGRLSVVSSSADFSQISLKTNRSISPLRTGSRVADEVMKMIVDRAEGRNAAKARSSRPRSVA